MSARSYQDMEVDFLAARLAGDVLLEAHCVAELAWRLAHTSRPGHLQALATRGTHSLRCQAARAALVLRQQRGQSPASRHLSR